MSLLDHLKKTEWVYSREHIAWECLGCGNEHDVGHKGDCVVASWIRQLEGQARGNYPWTGEGVEEANLDRFAGLYDKFSVIRNDCSKQHERCDYFPLDLTHDPAARVAARDYALEVTGTRPRLAADLYALIGWRIEAKLAAAGPDCPSCNGTGKYVDGSACTVCSGG